MKEFAGQVKESGEVFFGLPFWPLNWFTSRTSRLGSAHAPLPIFQIGSWCDSSGDSNQRVMVIS